MGLKDFIKFKRTNNKPKIKCPNCGCMRYNDCGCIKGLTKDSRKYRILHKDD